MGRMAPASYLFRLLKGCCGCVLSHCRKTRLHENTTVNTGQTKTGAVHFSAPATVKRCNLDSRCLIGRADGELGALEGTLGGLEALRKGHNLLVGLGF